MTPNEWKQFRALLGLISEAADKNEDDYGSRDRTLRARGITIAQNRFVGALTAAITQGDPYYIQEAQR